MIQIRETTQPRPVHPEAGCFPTGDPVSDLATLGVPGSNEPNGEALTAGARPHPRLVEMAQFFAECTANGPGADFQDLINAGYSAAEISEYAQGARELAKTLIVRRTDTASALVSDHVNEAVRAARMGEFSRAPHKILASPLSSSPSGVVAGAAADSGLPLTNKRAALDDLWSAYCFSHSASRIDPWPGQFARVLTRLQHYLARTAIPDATAKRILDGVAAEQRAMRT